MDDDDGPVFVWTCEVGGHTEESYEVGEPPDPETWEVIDQERRFGNCNCHITDGVETYFEDDGETPIQRVDVDGKPYGSGRPGRVDPREEARRQARADEDDRKLATGGDPDT